jgi:GT2 family glycosyltransferase
MLSKKVLLSIIILNYNTKQLVIDAIASIEKNYPTEIANGTFEIIVADNASTDGSLDALADYKKKSNMTRLSVLDNKANIGFAKGNNQGVTLSKGKYVLFLNPDTIVYPKTVTYLLDFLQKHPEAGAVSCKLLNRDGELDFNCHRGFPTPWNAFSYFSGLQRMFPKSKLFAGYTQGWKDMTTTHEVDAVEGAFLLLPRIVGEKVGWFDEDYFFYGEDLQLCFDIKIAGYKIYYVGEVSIMHIGGASSGIKKKTKSMTVATDENKRKVQEARFEAMKIFYRKNYQKAYPGWMQWMIFTGINALKTRVLNR